MQRCKVAEQGQEHGAHLCRNGHRPSVMERGRASLRRRLRQLSCRREKCAASTAIGLGCAAPWYARCLTVDAAKGAPAAGASVTRGPAHAVSLWQAAGHPRSWIAHPCSKGISEYEKVQYCGLLSKSPHSIWGLEVLLLVALSDSMQRSMHICMQHDHQAY